MNNKICLLADTHFGTHRNDEKFLHRQFYYFIEEIIPYLKENEIKNIIFLGDLFNDRSTVNVRTINKVIELLENLKDFEIDMILGNHDIYYNSILDVHSIKMFDQFKNINIISSVVVKEIFNKKLLLCPWVVNEKTFLDNIRNYKDVNLCFGHFDIVGANFNKYKVSDFGFSPADFIQFKKVFSGHYHSRSIKNVGDLEFVYIGSPYQLTRVDIDENKGFCVLDLETEKYEFVNEKSAIKYVSIDYPIIPEQNIIKGNIVDLNIQYDLNTKESDIKEYIEKIEKMDPFDEITINIKSTSNISTSGIQNQVSSIEQLMSEYMKNLVIDNKEVLEKMLFDVYDEIKEKV